MKKRFETKMPILSKTITQSITTGTVTAVECVLPISYNSNMGILIHAIEWIGEMPASGKFNKWALSFQQKTDAFAGIENLDVIASKEHVYTAGAAGSLLQETPLPPRTFKIPVLIVNERLWLNCYHDKGSAMTMGVRIWYTTKYVSAQKRNLAYRGNN